MNGVAFLLGSLTDGGSETKTVRLANRLSKTGYDVHLIYLDEPHTLLEAVENRVAVKFLERRSKFSLRALRELKSYLDQNDIELVFCINQYPLIYGWPACRLGGRKRRCIGAVNTFEFTSLRDRLSMLIYAYILRRCDLVVFGSDAQQLLWTLKYRLVADKTIVIYNGVDVNHFQQSTGPYGKLGQSLGIAKDAIVIGCVAHLRPEKSQGDLLAAMRKLSEQHVNKAVLLLVGDGSDKNKLMQYSAAHDLTGQVKFCGAVRDVRPYLAIMDIFVLPSSTEVFSNAILEAMAHGLPVVCTAVGGSMEMVVDGVTGITYPRHDVDSLVDALNVLMTDKDKREHMGQLGASRAAEVFSIQRMDDQYAGIISESYNDREPA